MWCREKTSCYDSVDVRNFSKSWANGNAFAAILHRFRPGSIDYASCNPMSTDKASHLGTCRKALAGLGQAGVAILVDAEDVVGPLDDPSFAPDEKAIVTQLSEIFSVFDSEQPTREVANGPFSMAATYMYYEH
jgi:hypothetical protein